MMSEADKDFFSDSYYLDDDLKIQKATNREESLRGFDDRDKKIVVQEWVGMAWLSTVFLVIDHSFGRGVPVLWESMTFNNFSDEEEQRRCSGERDEAVLMHEKLKAELFARMTPEEKAMHFSLTSQLNSISGVGYGYTPRDNVRDLSVQVQRILPNMNHITDAITHELELLDGQTN